MKYLLFVFALPAVLLTACGPKISEENQQKLEELTSDVDSLMNEVNKIDSTELAEASRHFFERQQFIKQEMKDTFETEVIFKLDKFSRLGKGMGFVVKEYPRIKTELIAVKEQMRTLNKDVDEGLIEDKRFIKYYQLETENYNMLEAATNQLMSVYNNTMNQYEEKLPFIDSLTTAYQAKLND